ncbi:unnamed protein product [Clonostachys solani]|uniref:Xylanolytic transcriptional activator regulatory domain-containing protein n=1 Tax=Clonostachys solani TaxID=160281 RepID=A0A9P0EB12_9HYPO|nr:unnamed protein product [Clonostachys solani]
MSLPWFIRPLHRGINTDDLGFLLSKGAVSLPSQALQLALVRAYVDSIYPHIPVIDLSHFLECITATDHVAPRVSLLLYQSILAAGTACVKIEDLKEAGFQTRKSARKIFLEKVKVSLLLGVMNLEDGPANVTKLLYDFNCELDQQTVIQVLLLMSLAYEEPVGRRSSFYWLDAAISQAFSSKLHHDPKMLGLALPIQTLRIRRRLWWCCYNLDRLVSLGTGRTSMISENDFNVSMPDISDFEPFRHVGSDAAAHSTVCSCNGSDQENLDLALLFTEQTRLCRLLDTNGFLAPSSCCTWQGVDWAIEGPPNTNWPFQRLEHHLSEWYSALPLRARYRRIMQNELGINGNAAVALNRSFLHLAFNMAMLNAYQSRLGLSPEHDIGTSYETEACELLMNHAAGRISLIMESIEAHRLGLCLHPGAMHFAMSASEVHLKRPDKLDTVAQTKHDQCARVIELMQEAYFVPSYSRHFRPSPSSPSASHCSQVERERFSEKNGTLPESISESALWEFDISGSTTSKAIATCNMADVEGLFPGRQITERWMGDPL